MKGLGKVVISAAMLVVLVLGFFFFRQSASASDADGGIRIEDSNAKTQLSCTLAEENVGQSDQSALPAEEIPAPDHFDVPPPAENTALNSQDEAPAKKAEAPKCSPSSNSKQGPDAAPKAAQKDKQPVVIHHDAEYKTVYHEAEHKIIYHEEQVTHHEAEYKIVHHDAEIIHHDAESEEVVVTDKDAYCAFRYAVFWCTSPACEKDGHTTVKLSSKDYDFSYEKTKEAYSTHAEKHLLAGDQASYTTEFEQGKASSLKYEALLKEQHKDVHAVIDLELIPAQTHKEIRIIKEAWDEVVREAYDEKVLIKEAWDEIVPAYDEKILVKDDWNETVLVKDAWDEVIRD